MLLLELYTGLILGVSGFIQDLTGLFPAEQLAYVQKVYNLPESGGVADTIIGVLK